MRALHVIILQTLLCTCMHAPPPSVNFCVRLSVLQRCHNLLPVDFFTCNKCIMLILHGCLLLSFPFRVTHDCFLLSSNCYLCYKHMFLPFPLFSYFCSKQGKKCWMAFPNSAESVSLDNFFFFLIGQIKVMEQIFPSEIH